MSRFLLKNKGKRDIFFFTKQVKLPQKEPHTQINLKVDIFWLFSALALLQTPRAAPGIGSAGFGRQSKDFSPSASLRSAFFRSTQSSAQGCRPACAENAPWTHYPGTSGLLRLLSFSFAGTKKPSYFTSFTASGILISRAICGLEPFSPGMGHAAGSDCSVQGCCIRIAARSHHAAAAQHLLGSVHPLGFVNSANNGSAVPHVWRKHMPRCKLVCIT